MITYDTLYLLAGLMFLVFGIAGAMDAANPKRWGNGLFWTLLAVVFLFASPHPLLHLPALPALWVGGVVIALSLVAGLGFTGRAEIATTSPEERQAGAARWKEWLFAVVLIVPAVTLAGTLWSSGLTSGPHPLIANPKQVSVISLVAGIAIASLVALVLFRPPPAAPLREGRRLMDSVGWAAILPQALASLGAVFALGKVGDAVGAIATNWLPLGTPAAAVAAYTVGMAAFTMIMGNAFAAFPVMTAAIGIPLIVGRFHGDPAVMGALGMLSGFCGTLMTPMAANFNVVPAALLELKDRNGVIKAQAPTAFLLLIANTVLMYVLAFRHA
ncbi:MAG: hypothetical protein JWP35_582 [Caulobacter sp.]|nr:hypothetical protein [Caulobacter sp.]